LAIAPDHVGFAAGSFHLAQRPEPFGAALQLPLHLRPFQTFMTIHVRFEARFQSMKKLVVLLRR
jgi:hypothetical protein